MPMTLYYGDTRDSHVGGPGVTREATHEDDAASVHADHGGQELPQYPDLAHQVDLNSNTL